MNRKHCLLFIFLLFSVYLPCFLIDFGMHNDYAAFEYDRRDCLSFPESLHMIAIGRPLGALLINLQFFFLHTISDLAVARFISFLICMINAILFIWYLRKDMDFLWLLMMTFCIFTLPASQLYIIWTATSLQGHLTVIIAFISFFMLERVNFKRKIHGLNIVYLSGAYIIFLASLFIYPASALFILVLTTVRIMFSPVSSWINVRLLAIGDILFISSSMIIYFIFHKFIF
ncbi:MAG: hypothetical protein ABRQ37_24250, partial [Candidatus Eremiobacterota bacterium]